MGFCVSSLCPCWFPLGFFDFPPTGRWIGDSQLSIGVKGCALCALWWTHPGCIPVPCALRRGSWSTAPLTSIKQLWKMDGWINEWINEWMNHFTQLKRRTLQFPRSFTWCRWKAGTPKFLRRLYLKKCTSEKDSHQSSYKMLKTKLHHQSSHY